MEELAMELKEFEKRILLAKEKGLLNDTQMNALLTKRRNIALEPKDRIPLTMQDRNALRILRNIVANSREDTKRLIIDLMRRPVIMELLSDVDKGVLCSECRTGLVMEGLSSRWIHKEEYDLIIEHIPAEICSNPDCKETVFTSATAKAERKIIDYVNETVSKIKVMRPEPIEASLVCPLCEQTNLEEGHTIAIYEAQQELYHLRVKNVPLKAYCTTCGYKELGRRIKEAIDELKETLEDMVFKLLDTK